MRVTIIGASGLLGSALAHHAVAGGHTVVSANRSGRADAGRGLAVDVTSGEGLGAAIDGADAVIYAANAGKKTHDILVDGLERTITAANAAGAAVVLPSIVGVGTLGGSYYKAKAQQEELLATQATRPVTLRITQFHEFVAGLLGSAAKAGISPRAPFSLQPVLVTDAAAAMLDATEAALADALPAPGTIVAEIAGPERLTLSQAARAWSAAQGRTLLPLRIPSALAGATSPESMCPVGADAVVAGPGFTEWVGASAPVAQG